MNGTSETTWVDATLPPWLWGNDIMRFAQQAHLKLRPVDASEHRWRIQALERYERRTPHLVERIEIAAPGGPARWEGLDRIPPTVLGPSVPPEMLEQARRRLVEESSDMVDRLNWLRLILATAGVQDFAEAARAAFESLRGSTDAAGAPVFPELSASFIRFDSALTTRAKIPRLLLRIAEQPELLTERPTQAEGQLAFGAGAALDGDLVLTRDAYLAPLLLCHSPYVWAIAGPRSQGVMVYNLGRSLAGRKPEPAELVQHFMVDGSPLFARPPATAAQLASALAWWVERTNDVLSVVTDPVTFADQTGQYSPRRHFEALLGFEQSGRRVQAVLAHQRDQPTRQLLAFAALDTLEGLGFVGFEQAVQLSQAQAVLERLTSRLPADVAAVLLPSARRAVEALRQCQDGFLEYGHISAGEARWPFKGATQVVSMEQATAQYLRVLRNAVHGYRGKEDAGQRRDQVLLASHTGDLPSDFPLVPYLHWLDALSDPQLMRRRLARRARR